MRPRIVTPVRLTCLGYREGVSGVKLNKSRDVMDARVLVSFYQPLALINTGFEPVRDKFFSKIVERWIDSVRTANIN